MPTFKVEFTTRDGFNAACFRDAPSAQDAAAHVRGWKTTQPGCRVFAYPAQLNVHGVLDAVLVQSAATPGFDIPARLAELASAHGGDDLKLCMAAYRALYDEWSERAYQASLPGLRAAAERFARTWIRDGD